MAIDNEDIVRHATVEGNLCDDVHAGVPKLQRNHGEVGFRGLKKVAATS